VDEEEGVKLSGGKRQKELRIAGGEVKEKD